MKLAACASSSLALAAAMLVATPAAAQSPMISSGAMHSCAIDTAGAAYCWGDNSGGQLGDGIIGAALKFDVGGLTAGVAAIGAGLNHACAPLGAGDSEPAGIQRQLVELCQRPVAYGDLQAGLSHQRQRGAGDDPLRRAGPRHHDAAQQPHDRAHAAPILGIMRIRF
jgi:hypothetical protein